MAVSPSYGHEQIVAYANRLPVTRTARGWRPSTGGLVAALQPALEGRGSWVGWDGGATDVPRRVAGVEIDLCPVALTRREVDDYYHGFSNRTLWPLLHGAIEDPVYDGTWWHAYREINERFAATPVTGANTGSFRWVHDYQLMLVPSLLRAQTSLSGPIGFFLHVPFPPPEVFARLPWREQILHGILGADAISFHTDAYRENFVRSCLLLRSDVTADGSTLRLDGRTIRTAAHPISIDATDIAERAVGSGTRRFHRALRDQFEGRRVLLGVDRLDYSKGILQRLHAVEMLLDRRPDLRSVLAFIQIAVPSRGEVREYRDLRRNVEELVGRINGRFTEPGQDVPIHYLHRGVNRDRLLAYYLLADVCLVTPLADGMNLVAKEFVVAQNAAGGAGALLLSEFAGASAELKEALPCNPFDIAGLTGMLEVALELDESDRRVRIEQMSAKIAKHDVFAWLDRELGWS